MYDLGNGIVYLSKLFWNIVGRRDKCFFFVGRYVDGAIFESNNMYSRSRPSNVELCIGAASRTVFITLGSFHFPLSVVAIKNPTPSEVSSNIGDGGSIGSIGGVVS